MTTTEQIVLDMEEWFGAQEPMPDSLTAANEFARRIREQTEKEIAKVIQRRGWELMRSEAGYFLREAISATAQAPVTDYNGKNGNGYQPVGAGGTPKPPPKNPSGGQPKQQAEPSWQPIESAPKDGSEILLANPDGSCAVGWFKFKGHSTGWTDGDTFNMTWPTHWMKLPTPPEAK